MNVVSLEWVLLEGTPQGRWVLLPLPCAATAVKYACYGVMGRTRGRSSGRTGTGCRVGPAPRGSCLWVQYHLAARELITNHLLQH